VNNLLLKSLVKWLDQMYLWFLFEARGIRIWTFP